MSNQSSQIQLVPGQVYIQDCLPNEMSKLYTLDITNGKANLVGEIATEVSDIAFVESELYGLDREGDKTRLVKIDIQTGDARVIGNIGFAAAGLAYNYQNKTLYATTAKQLITINTKTGKGQAAITVANKEFNCGEICFATDGTAYITLIGYNKNKLLATCNLETKEVKTIGDTGFPNIGSIEFIGDTLYGVTGNFYNLGKDGQLIRIDTKTGKGTLITTTDPIGRWAGISIYQPATVVTSKETSQKESPETSQKIQTVKENSMPVLTIDTKNNCYVIDTANMNNLQQNVASSFSFDKGTFDIRISGGRYSYAKSKTAGEPFVLLWIYGVDGSRFINKNTGFEVGATWTTLNGYNDSLKLEVKERAVVCALFFDFNNTDNSGSIDLLITSNKPFFSPYTLTVDSKRNCYVLDENYLSSLRQSGSNSIELQPGKYRLKIREGNASYWSDSKKFNIEPWALIFVQGGKFIPKLTGIETSATWCSLNGLNDEVILEVKETTTLLGLFFDTYQEDKEGQIIISIDGISTEEIKVIYQLKESQLREQTVTTGNVATTTINTERATSSVGSKTVSTSSSIEFSFNFNEAEFKKKWEEQLQQINASISIDNRDVTLEAKYWDQLENWLLKNYEKHFKTLAVDIAKLRFTMDAYIQQMEFSLNQHLQTWSGYLERIIEDKINLEISNRVNQRISQYIDQTFEQKVRNNIDLIINNIVNKTELNQYVDQRFNQSFENKVQNSINLITQNLINNNIALNQYVNQQIDNSYEQKLQNNLQLITQNIVNNNQEFNQYIDQRLQQTVVNNTEINAEIVNLVANSTEINTKIENIRNEWNTSFINLFNQHTDEIVNIIGGKDSCKAIFTQNLINNNVELNQYVNQQIDNSYEQKIQNNLQVITQNIVNNNQEFNQYIDQRLQQTVVNNTEINAEIVNLVANSTEINTKIENIRNEWNTSFINLFNQHTDEIVNIIGGRETFKTIFTQNLINNNTDLNQYISLQIDNSYEQKLQNNLQVITQNIVNNNQEFNQYIDQRLQQTVVNNTEINAEIVNLVANSTEINTKIENIRNEWNTSFINLFNQHTDELVNIIGGRDSFKAIFTQKIINNNVELNQYVNQQIDNTYQQKIQNNLQFITQNIVNNNQQLNQYIDNRLQQTVINNTTVNNDIINLVVNSTAINTKINNVQQELNIKIENIRNEWNRTFITLVTQQVDQIINIIVGRDTFNLAVANIINVKVDELINQIIRVKNELTVIINNADRHLYEWTLGELMAIKGCLTDRQALVELLISFSAEMRDKLDGAPCVDIRTFKPFKPISIDSQQSQQLPGR